MSADKTRQKLVRQFAARQRAANPETNAGPTGDRRRPYQQFVGVDGRQHSAPAGSGPLNPVRRKSRYYLGKGAARYTKGAGRPD